MLTRLNEVNDIQIKSVFDPDFSSFGRIVSGFDCAELISYMKRETPIPDHGNVYKASVAELEAFEVIREIETVCFGGMPIQAGYCNGRNTTYNGFEYHKGSELNLAVSDFMLVLAHIWQIEDNTITPSEAQVFWVPEGTLIEMYQTTLHLSPCRTHDEGFRCVVILPEGTNTPLSAQEKQKRDQSADPESVLLLQKNKWVLAHPQRKPLIDQGAHPGLLGENKELYY